MSGFECPVVRVTKVEEHPNADRLTLNYFREFITISNKHEDGSHRYKEGDLVVYVPEGAIVPEYLLKPGYWDENKGQGILAGSKGNRVKAIKLRGILSQGLMYQVENAGDIDFVRDEGGRRHFVLEGDDVAETLGITKYVPEIPASMSGEVTFIGHNVIPKFDVENIKKYPDVLIPGEEVVITEKLHGTMMGFGYIPGLDNPDLTEGNYIVFSKGLGGQGLVFKDTPANREKNVYLRAFFGGLYADFKACVDMVNTIPIFLFGELAGPGIQDLHYDVKKPVFRLFAMYDANAGVWAPWDELEEFAVASGFDTVPVLDRGPWHPDMRKHTDGVSTLANHVREGIVVWPVEPRRDDHIGQVVLKDVSEGYLTRKGGTEYN